MILQAYLHEIAQACMAAYHSALLLNSQPHHASPPHQQHTGMQLVLNLTLEPPCADMGPSPASSSTQLMITWASPSSTLRLQWLKWNLTRLRVASWLITTGKRGRPIQHTWVVRRNSSLPAHRRGCRPGVPISNISEYPPEFSRVDAETRQGRCSDD